MSLRIEAVIVRALQKIAPVVVVPQRRNRNLADQLDRASASILLNTAEGAYSQKGNQKARYFSALGSASETRSCLTLAQVTHGLNIEDALRDDLDHVIAVLWKLTR